MLVEITRRVRDRLFSTEYASLQEALNQRAIEGLRRVSVTGVTTLSAALTVPANCEIIGDAAADATILLPAAATFAALDHNSVSNVSIRDITLGIVGNGSGAAGSYGIYARGQCDRLSCENIIAEGFANPVRLSGFEGGSAVNAAQVITIGGAPTGGTWGLSLWPLAGGDIQGASGIAFDASAAVVQAAIQGIPAIGSGNAVVTGANGGPWTVTFSGSLAGRWLPFFRVASVMTGGNPTVSVYETARGGGPWLSNVHLTKVRAKRSPTSWGIHVDDVDGAVLSACESTDNWLDGLKLRKYARNVQIIGGHYSKNGVGLTAASPNGGDGIDTYAGGDSTQIIAVTCTENRGNGIQIKNDDGTLSGFGAGKYGLTRKLDIIGAHLNRNAGAGLDIIEAGTTAINSFSVAHINVIGGEAEENLSYGAIITGRFVSLTGFSARRNVVRGVYWHQNSSDGEMSGCRVIANGSGGASTGLGVYINGKRIVVRGGMYYGADNDALTDATDLTAGTKQHTQNIYIGPNSVDCFVADTVQHGNSYLTSIQVDALAINARVDQRGTMTPNVDTIHGMLGSRYEKTNATTPGERYWIKEQALASAGKGWRRLSSTPRITAISAAFSPTESDDDFIIDCTAGQVTITLLPASSLPGKKYRFFKKDASANGYLIDPAGAELINGVSSVTKTTQNVWYTIECDGTQWWGG